MVAETFLGTMLIAAWAAVVLRGLERTALAARKERAYLVGLTVGAAFGVGIVRSIKNGLSGFLLARVLDLRSGPLGEGVQRAKGKRPSDQNGKLGRMG